MRKYVINGHGGGFRKLISYRNNTAIIKIHMKDRWNLCSELRNEKIETWSCEVGFERSDQIEIE
jgi:hypothetical protein